MSDTPVIAKVDGQIGRIILNNPKALHALNMDMCLIITEALLAWAVDERVALVTLEHAEDTRGFCAGGDIKMLAQSGAEDGMQARAFFAAEYRLNTLIHNYTKPFIAFIDGITMGGGVGISVHGHARIATERTVFAMPESSIGLFPDVGGGWFLPRLKGELGTWLGLTGWRLKGEDVLASGVATHFITSDNLSVLKEALLEDGLTALDGLQTQAKGSWLTHSVEMEDCFAHERMEDIMSALENSSSEWANKQAEVLKTKCPQTLKVTLKQLREGRKLTRFEDNMRMEYRIGSRIVKTADFIEGVRAVVVDKDHAPVWMHASVADVPDAYVDSFFEPLGEDELTFLEEEVA